MASPPVLDYEGSDYRTRFWEGQGRDYEDRVERVALRRLMPPAGKTLIEIGAGFGRLANEYTGYDQVVLFDYSRTLLREAQAMLGDDPRFIYVAGNWYKMPFVSGLFDAMVQIRTIHHAADVPSLFAELGRIARPGGNYVLEFANKKNLKAILRHAIGHQEWSPYAQEPIEFVELNFDFHPTWIQQQLTAANFIPGRSLSVSYFRLGLLKRLIPTGLLAGADSLLQRTSPLFKLSPSVFVHSQHPAGTSPAQPGTFFACPDCKTPLDQIGTNTLSCTPCNQTFNVENGLFDFKEPASSNQ